MARANSVDEHGIPVRSTHAHGAAIPPKKRMRGLELAAASVAFLSITTALSPQAQAKAASSLFGGQNLIAESFLSQYPGQKPRPVLVKTPERFAILPEGRSISGIADSLSGETKKMQIGGAGRFVVETEGNKIFIHVSSSKVLLSGKGFAPIELNFSSAASGEISVRIDASEDYLLIHLINLNKKTDLVFSLPLESPSLENLGAMAYCEARSFAGLSGSEAASAALEQVLAYGESMLLSETGDGRPFDSGLQSESAGGELSSIWNSEERWNQIRKAYQRVVTGMRAKAREILEQLPESAREEFIARVQVLNTATMLRIYLLYSSEALRAIDSLRLDSRTDFRAFQDFTEEYGISEEFNALWPQCGIGP